MRYPAFAGMVDAEIWKPPGPGPFPAVVLSLGVIPLDLDHPQLERLQNALARAGFAVLLHWSPAMREYRLEPSEITDLASAFEWLLDQPYVDPTRCGLIGTCVGGSFSILAATDQRIHDRIAFLAVFAPYSSMRSLARDIASSSRWHQGRRVRWEVDPLSRRVFEESIIAALPADEAIVVRVLHQCSDQGHTASSLSADASSILRLLHPITADEAVDLLNGMTMAYQKRLDTLSPDSVLDDLDVPLIALMHDVDDPVVPPSESLALRHALSNRAGFRYTRFSMFRHLDPTATRTGPVALVRELIRFFLALLPIFKRTS